MLITGVYNYFKIICNKCKPISENENYPTLVTVSSSITYIQKAFLSQPDIFCHVNCISCHFKNVFLNGVAMLNSLLGQEMPIMRDITKTVQYMYGLCPSLNGRPSPLALLPRLPHSTSCRVDVTALRSHAAVQTTFPEQAQFHITDSSALSTFTREKHG